VLLSSSLATAPLERRTLGLLNLYSNLRRFSDPLKSVLAFAHRSRRPGARRAPARFRVPLHRSAPGLLENAMADIDRPTEPVAPDATSRVGESARESVRDLSELYRRFSAYLEQESRSLQQGISSSDAVVWDRATADALAGLHEELGALQGHAGA
jgi:hypothetical protein